VRAGVAVAAVNADSVAANRSWSQRLHLPYPLLSDPERSAAAAFGGLMRFGIAGWTVELFRRRTVLAGGDGVIAAVWDKVPARGHAAEVLRAARALERLDEPRSP
jgi:peroxiredoxin Q/BCP